MKKLLIVTILAGSLVVFLSIFATAKTIDTESVSESIISLRQKIDYPETPKSKDKKVTDLIFLVGEYTIKIGLEDGTYKISGQQPVKYPNQKAMEQLKTDFFAELKTKYGDLVRNDNYYHFLCYTLPRFLAQYGIFTEIIFGPKIIENSIVSSEVYFNFYDVSRKESIQIGERQYDIIFLSQNTMLNNKAYSMPYCENQVMGMSYFQNIAIDPQKNSFLNQEYKINDDVFYQQVLQDGGESSLWDKLARVDADEEASCLGYALFLLKTKNQPYQEIDTMNFVVAHESGHIDDYNNPIFLQQFTMPIFTDANSYQNYFNEMNEISEISAYLKAMQICPDKRQLVYDMIHCYSRSDEQTHSQCMKNLANMIIQKIKKNPGGYNFVVNHSLTTSIENQIIFQFANFLTNPKILETFATELKDDLQSNQYQLKNGTQSFASKWIYGALVGFILITIMGVKKFSKKKKKNTPKVIKKNRNKK